MQVHVIVRVDVVELQARRAVCVKLCANFCLELPPRGGVEEEVEARSDELSGKLSIAVNECRNRRRIEQRFPVDHNYVQSNT